MKSSGDSAYGLLLKAICALVFVAIVLILWGMSGNFVSLTQKTTAATTSSATSAISSSTTTINTTGRTVGLFVNDPQAFQGYTLLAPIYANVTYLIDNEGRVVHTWTSSYLPGESAYLLPNGNLIRAASLQNPYIYTGGGGGRFEEYSWNGTLIWQMNYSTDEYTQHHDFTVMPDGDILTLVVEKKSYAQAVAAGFNLSLLNGSGNQNGLQSVKSTGYILPDSVVEIRPTFPVGGVIVWEWHVWDHLIQNYSSHEANYGNVSADTGLINANNGGYGHQIFVFWNHLNSIAYNASTDQIMLSVYGDSEIWVIDHGTATAQAASHAGGRYGHGGDLLYRWGNPAQYGAGSLKNETLFRQHDASWIPANLPGAGDILVFNNGLGRGYSTVDELAPPQAANGSYVLKTGSAFGPKSLTWTYRDSPPTAFYAPELSSAQRLPNGDTLICDGINGTVFEVNTAGSIVWDYVNPVAEAGVLGPTDPIPLDQNRPDQYLNEVFKAQRYAPDYPGLTGKNLTPGAMLVK